MLQSLDAFCRGSILGPTAVDQALGILQSCQLALQL